MKTLKIIFIGTGYIGIPLLEACRAHPNIEVSLVVTGVDKPAGRKLTLQPSPIKELATKLNLEVFQPENINTSESLEKMQAFKPDLILLFSYGQILSKEVLSIPTTNCLNVHASLLPKYRGASPVQSAILNQDQVTGISLMQMVEKMDAGPVYKAFEIKIEDDETLPTLEEKLGKLSAEKIPPTLIEVFEGKLEAREQEASQATYTTKITKADGQINWNEGLTLVHAKIRAFTPWPGSFTSFKGKRLKILKAGKKDTESTGTPGLVTENGIVCIGGFLQPEILQIEGKNPQPLEEFLNGHPDFIGSVLTSV